MAYAQVSYGSTGSSVSALQEKLNANGYDLEVDGQFGPATQKAVKDYQKKKGLQVDGIAGAETWGSLLQSPAAQSGPTTGKQVLSGVSDETADRLAWLEQGYAPGGEVDAALAEWESVAAANGVSDLCRSCLAIMCLLCLFLNLAQVLAASLLHNVSVSVSVPLLGLAVCFVMLAVTKLLVRGKALQDDNDLFV